MDYVPLMLRVRRRDGDGDVRMDGDEGDEVEVEVHSDPDALAHWRENDAGMLRDHPIGKTTGAILRQYREAEAFLAQVQQESDSDEEGDGGASSPGFWLPTKLSPAQF